MSYNIWLTPGISWHLFLQSPSSSGSVPEHSLEESYVTLHDSSSNKDSFVWTFKQVGVRTEMTSTFVPGTKVAATDSCYNVHLPIKQNPNLSTVGSLPHPQLLTNQKTCQVKTLRFILRLWKFRWRRKQKFKPLIPDGLAGARFVLVVASVLRRRRPGTSPTKPFSSSLKLMFVER